MILPDPGAGGSGEPLGSGSARHPLTPEQVRAVEWGEGPLMVLAGAGTGKTTVVVERVARLVGSADGGAAGGRIAPDNVLVLTYDTQAAAELAERCRERLGVATASRLRVHNFHGLGHRILRDDAADAGVPPRAEVLDTAGQRLLLREVRDGLDLVYHQFHDLRGQLAHLADVVNRARDELVTPDEYRAHADAARDVFEARHGRGTFRSTVAGLAAAGDLRPVRDVRRALLRGGPADGGRVAGREARRAAAARDGVSTRAPADQRAIADGLRPTFLRDAEALEVLRVQEEAAVFAAYVARLRERGALDFGEQILRTVELLEERPNILRRYQRQFRHILVDEFQDANVAQIMLLELLGRAPDRPDNVVVVGDDDQAVYRFRGAGYAAFEQFRARFGRPPAWDPERAVAPVAETSLTLNLRSSGAIVTAADRLVAHNERRLRTGPLRTAAAPGSPIELIVAPDEHDEAEAVVDALRRTLHKASGESAGDRERATDGQTVPAPRWSDAAILYRRHRHRDVIEQHLRQAGIPFTVVGAAGLFDHPDVRDLECAIRVIARPDDSISATRLLAAAPWRLDAAQILRLARSAQFGGRTVTEAAADAVREDSMLLDAPERLTSSRSDAVTAPPEPLQLALAFDSSEPQGSAPRTNGSAPERPAPGPSGAAVAQGRRAWSGQRPPRFVPAPLPDPERARLALLVACLDGLGARAGRDGPFTLLESYVARTGLLRDLVAAATREAQGAALAIAGFMRFVAGWQRDHPRASLVDFVAYLDAFQEVGGDLDPEERTSGVDAVRLMTVHQAKGLEWDVVIVPRLVEGQFPDDHAEDQVIPVELLRQEPPPDYREAEERRLCYVAMTRARRHLVLTTIDDPGGRFRPSRFVAEIAGTDAPRDGDRHDEGGRRGDVMVTIRGAGPVVPADGAGPADGAVTGGSRRAFPDPRRRAAEIIGLIEGLDPDARSGRDTLTAELLALAGEVLSGTPANAPVTGMPLRAIGAGPTAGAELLRLVPVLDGFSHSSFALYQDCPLAYAFQRVYRIPVPEEARPGYFAFGSMVHTAFESFVRAGQEARAAGTSPPGEPELFACFERAWQPLAFPDRAAANAYRMRAPAVLRNFLTRERSRNAEPICLEQPFRLVLDPGGDGPRAQVGGAIDRIDRLADGGLELIDYKTGRPKSQAQVDADDQLSTYALAMRDGAVPDPETGLPLPAPALLTLYFAEVDEWISTTRSDAQLDEHRARLLGIVTRIRSGDFTARPDVRRCERCDYRRLCPNRWGAPA